MRIMKVNNSHEIACFQVQLILVICFQNPNKFSTLELTLETKSSAS